MNLGGGQRRVGTVSSVSEVYIATSRDGGVAFNAPLKVTTASSNWCTALSNIRPDFGDYIGAANAGAHVLPVWADSRNGAVDTFFSDMQP